MSTLKAFLFVLLAVVFVVLTSSAMATGLFEIGSKNRLGLRCLPFDVQDVSVSSLKSEPAKLTTGPGPRVRMFLQHEVISGEYGPVFSTEISTLLWGTKRELEISKENYGSIYVNDLSFSAKISSASYSLVDFYGGLGISYAYKSSGSYRKLNSASEYKTDIDTFAPIIQAGTEIFFSRSRNFSLGIHFEKVFTKIKVDFAQSGSSDLNSATILHKGSWGFSLGFSI